MISKATPQFWQRYAALPTNIRQLADKAYLLWKDNRDTARSTSRNWKGTRRWHVGKGISWFGCGLAIILNTIA